MGPGVPLYSARACRSGLRQGTTHANASRVVHASQWPDSGLRVELWRCEPTGPRLGRVAGLQSREEASRQRRPRVSQACLSQATVEFHLVGQPKDASGMNIFQGGFLGLDNIGVFDRSAPLPTGG